MIPVDFALPAESYVTDHDNPNDQVLWLLHAQADVPVWTTRTTSKCRFQECGVGRGSHDTQSQVSPRRRLRLSRGTCRVGFQRRGATGANESHRRDAFWRTEFYFPAFRIRAVLLDFWYSR